MKKIVLILLLLIIGIVQIAEATGPVASFTATPTSGVAPLTVQFTDTSSGNPTRWQWTFDDGDGSDQQNPSHIFSYQCNNYENSAHNVYLTVSDNLGNISQTNETIVILGVPSSPIASFKASPLYGPAPLTVQFTDTSTGNPNNWGYSFGDGTSSSLQNPTHTYTISGVYEVQMEANNIITVDLYTSTRCFLYQSIASSSSISVLSPVVPTTSTTSPTLSPNQTATITPTTTLPTTSVTAQTTLPVATLTQTVTATPSGFYYTPRQTATTIKPLTSYPTNTPTQKSPIGIEICILAICIGILIIRKQS